MISRFAPAALAGAVMLLALSVPAAAAGPARADEADLAALLDGVREIAARSMVHWILSSGLG